jgi:hypothetical protein
MSKKNKIIHKWDADFQDFQDVNEMCGIPHPNLTVMDGEFRAFR